MPTNVVPSQLEVSVVITTYQRSARVAALLEHLQHQTLAHHRFEVVVVDNCSTDDTSRVVNSLIPDLPFRATLHRTSVNRGPAAARNMGWQSTTTPLLAFLDDDVTPRPEWLEAGLGAFRHQPGTGVVQGRTWVPEGVDLAQVGWGPPNWETVHTIDNSTPFFESCNIFYRRQALEATGGFDEDIGLWAEDTSLGWQVLAAGWKRGFAPLAAVTHPIDRRGCRYFMRLGLMERNLIRVGAEHPSFREEAYWRPWAFRKEDAAFAAAVAGLVASLRFRPACLLLLPYVWWRRPSIRHLSFFRLCLQIPLVDSARFIGHIRGSVAHGVLVL
jgi:glycosyltransferase involved in cell wall biosynthesis